MMLDDYKESLQITNHSIRRDEAPGTCCTKEVLSNEMILFRPCMLYIPYINLSSQQHCYYRTIRMQCIHQYILLSQIFQVIRTS